MLPALPTGHAVQVGRVAQGVDDLEGRRLLAFDAKGVDRVDQGDGVVRARRTDDSSASSKLPPTWITSAPWMSA